MTQHLSEALLMDEDELFDPGQNRCWTCQRLILDIKRGHLCMQDPRNPKPVNGVFMPTKCKNHLRNR